MVQLNLTLSHEFVKLIYPENQDTLTFLKSNNKPHHSKNKMRLRVVINHVNI